MASLLDPAVPKGSTVVVTGTNGFIGSHVADQFLKEGYNVRGTVRDTDKNIWLRELFEKKYGPGRFELLSVPDISIAGSYDHVAKGASAFIHVAAIVGVESDPNKVIPTVVAGAVNALKAAYAEPAIKRFVLTSSSSAVLPADTDTYMQPVVVTEDSWSEDAVKLAWAPPPYAPERGLAVYAASKVESEQAVWKYHKEHQLTRPDLTVNTVLPNLNFGKSLDAKNQGHPSSSGMPLILWQGIPVPEFIRLPQNFVDVQDTAILHVAATILPNVQNERIFAFAEPFNWDRVLAVLRKQNPGHAFPDDFEAREYPHIIKPKQRAEELLKAMGRSGWTSLEDSLLQNTEDVRQV